MKTSVDKITIQLISNETNKKILQEILSTNVSKKKKKIKGIFINLSKVLIFWNLEAKFKSLPERITFNKLLMLHIL